MQILNIKNDVFQEPVVLLKANLCSSMKSSNLSFQRDQCRQLTNVFAWPNWPHARVTYMWSHILKFRRESVVAYIILFSIDLRDTLVWIITSWGDVFLRSLRYLWNYGFTRAFELYETTDFQLSASFELY